ncbi:hypothetical protein BOTBODRAFT_352587 [Botryobasidium botryosum FD-172 SS1]|uniref:Uncharacterized protein n=1 Tax=Botryobasidium botryosum (strain FD-172 SS1) TaxID=930990 RepID=A0A067MF39_BOTB1|nr:hypothetical protein BOTBODRAFT_352587 [Botryobasidium botryosum FD-172 SS1]
MLNVTRGICLGATPSHEPFQDGGERPFQLYLPHGQRYHTQLQSVHRYDSPAEKPLPGDTVVWKPNPLPDAPFSVLRLFCIGGNNIDFSAAPGLSCIWESHHSVSLALAAHSVYIQRVASLFAALRFFLSPPNSFWAKVVMRPSTPYHG